MTTDIWTTEKYQHAAAFVPKLAGKIVGWLDVQPDDVILDIGCGDGILDVQMGAVLAQGAGALYGVDQSPAMIAAAEAAVAKAQLTNCTFATLDVNGLADHLAPDSPLRPARFTKAFSNAALHWILRPADRRPAVFAAIRDALQPGALFAFEMGGLGNVTEMVTAVVAAVARRIGLPAAIAADPWFFPDEAWVRDMLEVRVGGWRVERAEREWRPTPAEVSAPGSDGGGGGGGGVDGWVRLMARPFLDAIADPVEREAATREAVSILEYSTRQPGGTYNINYVRLRVLARKL